ncbi:hypothetical protein C8D87_114137 [Lentzea atacamensis]|uniref:Uncharacterized protein n=1 Tax=Lentzea atacamensis TaxID=531938 RepID=A0ABX9DZ75_9PSEU|nr:hypothetical protein C8D87_114137 [Lentzea atacamensis]
MSTRPSTGRRPRPSFEETLMFDMRRDLSPTARRLRLAKVGARRRDRRAARQRGWGE